MRFARAVLLAVAATGVLTGCGGSSKSGTTTQADAADPTACSTAVARGPGLRTRTAFLDTPGTPFGIATTADGQFSFVDDVTGHISVYDDADRFVPRAIRTVALTGSAIGNSLTPNGRYLLVADDHDGATVIDVERAESGAAHPVLGKLTAPAGTAGTGAIEVTMSPDGRYAFVSNEYDNGGVAVYDLAAALADGFRRQSFVGIAHLGLAPVGMAVSPDGRWLYATSEVARGGAPSHPVGTLSVINIAKAERNPSRSIVATVAAGCEPVRVAVSPAGGTVWVTARASDELLAFSAAKLLTDPRHALEAAVGVGQAPVGLALVDGGSRVVVADSNRFNAPGGHAALSVVSGPDALAHRPALLGTIDAGSFPREMSLEPGGTTLLVGNFGSGQLEAVDVRALP